MRKILVGVDGSEASVKAVRMAGELAAKNDARLVLFHAIFPNLLSPAVYPELVKQLEKEERAASDRLVAEVVEKAGVKALSPEVRMVTGAAPETIADVAATDDDVWMVVVGSHGRNAALRVLLGSTPDRLIHICQKPVLVVR